MIVDIDAGNSSLKWVAHNGDIDEPAGRGRVLNAEVADWLNGRVWNDVHRVRLSSVAGSITDLLQQWGASRAVTVQVARVVDGCAGVRCGYREPAKLGIDRWLALLAAKQRYREHCLVVDAGTALTVDVLSHDGVHSGGYIAPGIALMVDSLGSNTWGVRVDSLASSDLVPGVDTAQAVSHGCLAAAVGMVVGIALSRQVSRLVVTGGDARLLAERLTDWLGRSDIEVIVDDSLVLRGLGLALP